MCSNKRQFVLYVRDVRVLKFGHSLRTQMFGVFTSELYTPYWESWLHCHIRAEDVDHDLRQRPRLYLLINGLFGR